MGNAIGTSSYDAHLRRIKIYFSFLIVFLILAFAAGSMFLKGAFGVMTVSGRSSALSVLYRAEYLLSSGGKNTAVAAEDNGILVFVYHGILDKPDGSNFNTTVADFKSQMFALKSAGYNTITLDALYKYLRGEVKLPPKSVILTFDDGRFDSFYNGDPILRAVEFKAVMFVITNFSADNETGSGSYYLTSQYLKSMELSGRWDIEVHTQNGHSPFPIDALGNPGHFFSHKAWILKENRLETDEEFEDRVDTDFALGSSDLEQVLNKKPIGFAFPYGDFGQHDTNYAEAMKIVPEVGKKYYGLMFYQDMPSVRFHANYFTEANRSQKSFLIKRIDTGPGWKGADILASIERSLPKSLPYSDSFEKDNGWIKAWGSAKVQTETRELTLDSLPQQLGAAAILDGTRLWKDYYLTAEVDVPYHNNVYVWVRFKDDNNNAACNFGSGFVHIEQTVNGEKRVIKGERGADIGLPSEIFTVGVKAEGRSIECLINDKSIVKSDFVSPALEEGGIGIKTWDPAPGLGLLHVKNVMVEKLEPAD